MENLPAHYTVAQANMGKMSEKIKRKREEMGHDDNFRVGEQVMRANIHQEQRKGEKMESSMLGPFTIVKLEGKSADLVMLKSKVIHKVNIDQLTRYIEATPRIPHKWLTESSSTISVSPSSPVASTSAPAASPSPPSSAVCVPSTVGMKVDSDTLETVVQNIWAGEKPEVLWSKLGPYKLFTHNLREHLCPDELVKVRS
ncbi:uncharacterized protein LOC117765167 isoform X2 [Hippoglossus hippoglossus]|nr:uncharacterized protein LOC117765167 isoform X2 [Hippoglossus hippoglossus]